MAARLLLVHSPLVGPATWDLVAADLAGRGCEVGVPDLTGTVTAGPPYCPRQAEVIARSASGRPAILIGHSGAGPLLAAAGALIDQVRGYVFADAGLPTPGQTWMDTVPPELAAHLREIADDQGWACRAGDVEVRRDQQTLAVNADRRDMSLQRFARVDGDVISRQKSIRGAKERQGVTSTTGAEIEYARGGAGEPESTPVSRRIRPRVTSIVEATAIIMVVAFRDKRPLGHHRSRREPGRMASVQR
jgi:hypothetical protein